MTDFNGKLISNTYKSLLTVNASTTGTGVTTSLVGVQTADGTQTAIKIATNKVHIAGNIGVSGNLSVQDKVCASAYFGDGSNLTGLTASIGGSISVGNALIDGTVTVTGTAIFKDDVSVSGALNVASNTSIGGTLVNTGAGTFSSTVTVVGKGTFKDDVSVSGVLGVKGNVSVEGNTSLGGTLGVTGAGTFTAKTEFKDDVSVSGNLDVAGNVSVGGTAIFNNNVSVSGNVNVNANVTALFFYGDGRNLTNVEAELGIVGNISVSGFINAGGDVSITGAFNAVGAATFKDDVSVSGNLAVGVNASITGALSVAGAVDFNSTLDVAGNTSIGGIGIINGAAKLNSTVTVLGAAALKSTVTVVGAGTFKDDVSVSGNVVIGGTVTISGANVQAANAKVCASAYYGDGSNLTGITASIEGNISVNNATIGGNLFVGGTATVVGAAGFSSTVTVAGNVSIGGTGTVGGAFAVSGGAIDLRTSATDPSYIRFYCESNNAHYAQLRSPPHASYSGNITITLPTSTVTIVGTSTTDTLTNKTFGDATQFEAAVTVEGAAHLQSTVSVGGAAVFASTVTVVGAVHLQSTVSVAGAARLDTIELGAASDTTLARASAGNVNIEGNLIYRAGGTDVPVADGGTGASTLTNGGVLLGSGTDAITAMAVLGDGEMIVGDGTTDPVAESGSTLRSSIGVAIGSDVAAYNADTLFADVADNLTAGFSTTVHDAGTKSSGTYTPDQDDGNIQKAVNGGAHTLAPTTDDCAVIIQYTNNASAGTITTSGFTLVDGDTITTTNGHDFFFYLTKANGFSLLTVKALQ